MGEGCIPVKKIRSWVEATGFNGFNEVEIFSTAYWKEDQADYLQRIIRAYKEHS
jgi:sugar phosphate isomerase/epimerase